jgi:hypothetical protein
MKHEKPPTMQLKSAEEAQAHAEETLHTNFEESTEAVSATIQIQFGKKSQSVCISPAQANPISV